MADGGGGDDRWEIMMPTVAVMVDVAVDGDGELI